ncbi:hypothetical protein QJ850_gp463 [Acanthamoeba polyphaga mimivirus]|uniref:Uncharacterized protein n=1 Tax=Acanthamoeba polyphaga mimivirus Kroon TaxID=3069720 RepID=A0A0G2YAX7_9VIRU|nr:hypothetical protein QJ850_gp463 [Acanthamoeba polyphaga mimivirus]AKI80236.1 hypothetical protein [Acanthamoeba polyphaga mimivirus Kroon]
MNFNKENILTMNDKIDFSSIKFQDSKFKQTYLKYISNNGKKLSFRSERIPSESIMICVMNYGLMIYVDDVMRSCLEYMDNYFSSDEVKKLMFGPKYDKMTYVPTIRKGKKGDYIILYFQKSQEEIDSVICKNGFKQDIKLTGKYTSSGKNEYKIHDSVNDSETSLKDYLSQSKDIQIVFHYKSISKRPNTNSYGVKLSITKIELDNPIKTNRYYKIYYNLDVTKSKSLSIKI